MKMPEPIMLPTTSKVASRSPISLFMVVGSLMYYIIEEWSDKNAFGNTEAPVEKNIQLLLFDGKPEKMNARNLYPDIGIIVQ